MFYAGKEHNDNVEHFAHNQNDAVNSNLTSQLKQQLTIGTFLVFFCYIRQTQVEPDLKLSLIKCPESP